ncbi:type II secretion system F family protein [Anaerobium acetethylicum]|uniref:Tight adherence protein B n=1 Tax=Anaerobium acetethylicum TaxID=1619234 RepID=A0A1D3TRK7_9FIRM|nr:type II secretion system F family protein [Anaerobium acetethylicum]SCP96367.1 tight adherence protein B [Anaerobium acetethylicum]
MKKIQEKIRGFVPCKRAAPDKQAGGRAVDYRNYRLTERELMVYTIQGIGTAAFVGYIFYHSLIAMVFLLPYVPFFLKRKKAELRDVRLRELNYEFREGIMALSAALGAGYSVENAFREALADLRLIYGDDRTITREFRYMAGQIEMNVTVEKLLLDLAERSGLEDIKSFAEVFATAKRSGGDLIMIIRSTASRISQKAEVQREIVTTMMEKQFEQKIMSYIPFFIIFYMKMSNPEFMEILYGNVTGAVVMTICLVIYICSVFIAGKITGIEV